MKFSDQRLVKWFQHLCSPYLTSKHSNYPQQRDPHGTAFPCLLYLETTDHSTIRNEPLVELTNAKCKAFPSWFKGYRVLSESSGRDPRWKYVLLRHTKNHINHRFREVSGKVVLNVACLETLAEQPGKNPRVGFGQAEEFETSRNVAMGHSESLVMNWSKPFEQFADLISNLDHPLEGY